MEDNRPRLYPSVNSVSSSGRLSREDQKFASFEASVSDAWSVEDCEIDTGLAQSSAQSVLEDHSKKSSNPGVRLVGLPPCASHLNRTIAIQRLATQQDAFPSASTDNCRPSSLYPQLSDIQCSIKSSKRCPDKPDLQDQRYHRIKATLNRIKLENRDFEELKKECWKGIPAKLRPQLWRMLMDYAPLNTELTAEVLRRKQNEYFDLVEQYFHTRHDDRYQDTFRQISIDVPRMCPVLPLLQQKAVQEIFERILYIWALRHPGSGYVQGINDLVTPFFVVFLSEYLTLESRELIYRDITVLSRENIQAVEADTFWCFTFLLDTIQDNYTFAQPGIQQKIKALNALVAKVDPKLDQHLQRNQVEYLQFAFRWMNNILMREIPLSATIRLWDTYLSTPNGFAQFHLYVCVMFLCNWSAEIQREPDFQSILLFLQNLPTKHWGESEITELTAKAYRLKLLYADAPSHLRNNR